MPKVPIAVVTADCHNAEGAWASRAIHGDAYYSFEQIVSAAVDHYIDLLVAGDLNDRQRNRSAPIAFLYKQLDRFHAVHDSTPDPVMYFVEGQHDADDPPWPSGHPGAFHLHKQLVDIAGIKMYGLNYLPSIRLQEELAAIPEGTDVLLAHQSWSNWMGEVTVPQGEFADIPKVPLVITGDLHQTRMEKHRGKDGQPMVVFSPGSTCMQDISEPPEKYYGVLFDDLSVQKVLLRTRRFRLCQLSREADAEKFIAEVGPMLERLWDEGGELPEEIRKPIIRAVYSASLPDMVRRIANAVGDRAHLFFKELPVQRAEEKPRPTERGLDEALTPLALLSEEVDKTKEPEVFSLCARLLSADDKKAELARWRLEYLEEASL